MIKTVKTLTVDAELISTRAAALLLGVSESSIKRWCDKGHLELVKSPGGHRRLRLASVRRLALEMGQVATATSIEPSREPLGLRRARAELSRSLLAGDEASALAAFEYARGAVAGAAELADEVIAPVFAEVGARWSRGSVQIYEERRACELMCRALSRMSQRLAPAARPGLSAIGGSLSGDPFTLPSLLAELVLREAGCDARSLGSGLPAATLEIALRERQPHLLWVCVAAVSDERELLRDCERLHRAASERGVSLVFGGRGLTPGLRRRMRFAAYCESMVGLRELAFALMRMRRP